MNLFKALFLGFSLLLLQPSTTIAAPSGTETDAMTAIVGADVLTMTDAGRLENQTVLLRGDRILALGPLEDIVIPDGTRRIDGCGLTLMPGLVDMHIHLAPVPGEPGDPAQRPMAVMLGHGVTTARGMAGSPANLVVRNAVEEGTLAGPRFYAAAPGTNFNNAPTPEAERKAVADAAAAGYDLIRMMYVRFPLSLRNVEDLLAERGIDICHETVRHWWNRLGPRFAADIRRQRVSRMRSLGQWHWHLDEIYVKINGEMHYLWRAVNQEGEVLESNVTKTRDKAAALRFMRKALKRHGSPETITTDGLRSYKAAMNELGCEQKQEIGRCANNRAENSHLPFRRRERAMLRFRQMKALQKFASVHANIHNHFNSERHLIDRETYKIRRLAALVEWQTLMA